MKLRVLGYAIFVVFCVCIAVYRHFPGDTASTYIQQTLSKFNPNLTMEINGIKPAFPPGIKTDTILVNYAGIPLVGLEDFKLGVDLLSVFSDARRYPFKGVANDGTLSGSISSLGSKEGQMLLETEFTALVFDRLDLGKHMYDLQFSGAVTGKIAAKMDTLKLKTSQGNIHIENALFELGSVNLWMDEIAFSAVKVMFTMSDPGTLKIETCTMRGKQLDIDASGDIKIAQLFENSRLNLAVSIQLHPRFFMEAGSSLPAEMTKGNSDGTKLEVTIGGTLQNPKIKMLQEKQ